MWSDPFLIPFEWLLVIIDSDMSNQCAGRLSDQFISIGAGQPIDQTVSLCRQQRERRGSSDGVQVQAVVWSIGPVGRRAHPGEHTV